MVKCVGISLHLPMTSKFETLAVTHSNKQGPIAPGGGVSLGKVATGTLLHEAGLHLQLNQHVVWPSLYWKSMLAKDHGQPGRRCLT